jgi:Cu-Zn family superoxide dismutase
VVIFVYICILALAEFLLDGHSKSSVYPRKKYKIKRTLMMTAFQVKRSFITLLLLSSISAAYSAVLSSALYATDGSLLGNVSFEDTQYGLLIKPELKGLSVGLHGFHIHQHADCGEHGMKAGGHFDPAATNSHQGPYGKGHLGDLPVLSTNTLGVANIPLLAPRLTTHDILGHTLMIHAAGDNYSDNPALGGGGARIACGIIKE